MGVFTRQEKNDPWASPSGFLAIPLTAAGLHDFAQASTDKTSHTFVKFDPCEFNELRTEDPQ